MFCTSNVVSGAAVKVATGHLFLIELDQFTRGHAFLREARSLLGRTIAIDDSIRCCESGDFLNPLLNGRMRGRHWFSSVMGCSLWQKRPEQLIHSDSLVQAQAPKSSRRFPLKLRYSHRAT